MLGKVPKTFLGGGGVPRFLGRITIFSILRGGLKFFFYIIVVWGSWCVGEMLMKLSKIGLNYHFLRGGGWGDAL